MYTINNTTSKKCYDVSNEGVFKQLTNKLKLNDLYLLNMFLCFKTMNSMFSSFYDISIKNRYLYDIRL